MGGVGKYPTLERQIQYEIHRNSHRSIIFTTLIDLYGLPRDFPGKELIDRNPSNPRHYALALEEAFGKAIGHYRFIPHFQLHEYETMLFADPDAFRVTFGNCDAAIRGLKHIVASHPSIELINDGRDTAPSKRIMGLFPRYSSQKSTAGPDIAEFIGLETIRSKCPHLDAWLAKLESLIWDGPNA